MAQAERVAGGMRAAGREVLAAASETVGRAAVEPEAAEIDGTITILALAFRDWCQRWQWWQWTRQWEGWALGCCTRGTDG